MPGVALTLDANQFNQSGGTLLVALFAQVAACAVFIALQRHEIVRLETFPRSELPPGPTPSRATAG
jgi:hypothetical protein